MAKITDASEWELVKFLDETFQPDAESNVTIAPTEKMRDMVVFAKLARFLSDNDQIKQYARLLSKELEGEYRKQERHVHDGDAYRVVGAFSLALKSFAPHYGFSGELYILNGQLSSQQFAEVLSKKILIRDLFTRPHGEFTHTIQWLLLAYAFGDSIPQYYAKSVKYKSVKNFDAQGGPKRIYMWNFLVDCFDGAEDYPQNIFCKTFRCPQIFTERLGAVLPQQAWLGEFISRRRNKGLKAGPEAWAGGPYVGGRTIGMNQAYLDRTVPDLQGGKPIAAYEQVAPNVYKKAVVELRRL
ncbi:hypothetical protein M8A51_22920 [Schlegelella sp. S2-27]|uniref:DUF5636 domain-containing protein n=1 Tax=Caldimonas mangrovi TaxID=2944811 RepID=A0ABT0YUG6_9BURK|nr:LirA/MavJ family T4SS effector [Caldimonas mangrovi]MCM5682390.1 hypothetical protein [Caldimonas mangrovi]